MTISTQSYVVHQYLYLTNNEETTSTQSMKREVEAHKPLSWALSWFLTVMGDYRWVYNNDLFMLNVYYLKNPII